MTEPDWLRWRDEFPILEHSVYLNSCSLGALSRRVESSIGGFLTDWHELGAAAWYTRWLDRLGLLRSRVATLLGGEEDEIALPASTSAALATIGSAIDYARRPRVVISELEFPTLAHAWLARPDVEVIRIPSDDGATIDPARFADAVDDRTALIATSHVFFTTGAIQDLRTLADIAHRRGALLLVDAYQSAGQLPIDVRRDDVDILLTGPLKWLLGGPGLAYAYVRRDRIATLAPTTAGWFGAEGQFSFDNAHWRPRADARRYELGTPALAAVHAALAADEIIDEIGVPAIRERNRILTERLIEGCAAHGLAVRVASRPEQRSAIVMVAHADPAAAVAALGRERIIVDWRPGYVRVSPHFYNTEAEVDRFTEVLAASP